VAVECLLAYFLFPSPEEVAALAEKNLQKSLPAALSGPDSHGAEANAEEAVEVDLGEYSITVTQADGASSLRVDFHLYGTVTEGEQEAMKLLFERNVNRFRDQVLYEIRNSASTDLADPGLALIKRRILEKSNTLLGKPVLKSVVFSQFSYFEQ
jgi:flagellar FliL protein